VPPFPGKRLGVYELEEEIGRGAMGIVYRGRQVTLDRVVAVKVLLESLVSDESFVTRFIREARLVASLNHPNIVQVYDAGRSENLLYFAMEYISGPTVTQLLKQSGKLPVEQAVEIVMQVASALEYAHSEARMVHRDIKPENMMLDRWGKVKVVDFGLARVAGVNTITRVGTVVGSLYYVSPEQLLGRQLDGRADVYALGVALYEMMTGQRPFRGKSLAELSHAIISGPLEGPSTLEPTVPTDLEGILLKAMERDRERRYNSAGEFEAELRRWAASAAYAEPERKGSSSQSIGAATLQADLHTERKAPNPPGSQPDAHPERKLLVQPSTHSERKPLNLRLPIQMDAHLERKPPSLPASQQADAHTEWKSATPPIHAASPPQPPSRPWSAGVGRPRDPSQPPITLPPLRQAMGQSAEPPAHPPSERAPRPQPRLTEKLPPAPPEGPGASSEEAAETDSTSSDLFKTAASQLQRLVWRRKKE